MHLYWFTSCKVAQKTLKDGQIPFQNTDQLRSPFLLNKPFANPRSSHVTSQEYDQEMERRYQSLPSHLKQAISLDFFIEKSEPKRKEIEAEIRRQASHQGDDAARLYPENPLKQVAVLGLNADCCHLGLWQKQPSDSVAVQIDARHRMLQSSEGNPTLLKPVQYGEVKTINASSDNPVPGIFELPPELASEQEWRVLKTRKNLKFKDNTWYSSFDRSLVQGLVFGPEYDLGNTEQDWKWLIHDVRYKQLKKFRIALDPHKLKLRLEPY